MRSDYQFVTETSLHLIDAGRQAVPAAVHAARRRRSGRDPDADEVITAAAVVELIHLATLYHDDVMDSATMRRGAQSANSRWDNTVAILTGDFLFAHASRLVADLGPDAVRIIAETFAELVTGQMRETRGPRPARTRSQHYLTVIAEKTGSLIATAGPLRRHVLRLPARAGGGAAPVRRDHRHRVPDLRRRHRHRLAVGQLRQDPRHRPARGRAHAADALRPAGHRTPTPTGCASCWPARSPTTPRSPRRWTLLRAGPGLARARDVLAEHAAAARAELATLPPCPATDALAALTTYVVDRTG